MLVKEYSQQKNLATFRGSEASFKSKRKKLLLQYGPEPVKLKRVSLLTSLYILNFLFSIFVLSATSFVILFRLSAFNAMYCYIAQSVPQTIFCLLLFILYCSYLLFFS